MPTPPKLSPPHRPCKRGHMNWSRHKEGVGGHSWTCKTCHADQQRERRQELRRTDPAFVERERAATLKCMRKKRADPEYVRPFASERERERAQQRYRRKRAWLLVQEAWRDWAAHADKMV